MENQIENYLENGEVHDGHRSRLRRRMALLGVDSFKNHELLEYLLFHVVPRQDVNELAHMLVNKFGNLKKLFAADMETLMQVEGMSESIAEWIYALGRLSDVWGALNPMDDIILDNYGKMFAYARRVAPDIEKPCCMQLLMDDHGRLLYQRILGNLPNQDQSHNRSLMKEALSDALTMDVHSAALIIFAGKRVSYPSNYDRDFSRAYCRMLNLMGISLMDVVIFGSNCITSLRRLNMISENLKHYPRNSLREGYISSIRPAKLKSRRYQFYSNGRRNYECTESL